MREFDYHQPATLAEASRMLADFGDGARVIAGGTALVLALRQRMLSPAHLVSVADVEALRGIAWSEGSGLRIGALTSHSEVARSAIVQQRYPMLAAMASRIADSQIRNQGTIGGNLCYADPATDPPGCLMALDAQVVLASRRGERVLAVEDFLVDYYTTALEPDELLLELRLPSPAVGSDGRYARLLRTAADHRPLVNVAIGVHRQGSTCTEARIVVGASTPVPMRIPNAEARLVGHAVTRELAAEVAAIVAQDVVALSDQRGGEAYRRQMAQVVTRRTLEDLFGLDAE